MGLNPSYTLMVDTTLINDENRDIFERLELNGMSLAAHGSLN